MSTWIKIKKKKYEAYEKALSQKKKKDKILVD